MEELKRWDNVWGFFIDTSRQYNLTEVARDKLGMEIGEINSVIWVWGIGSSQRFNTSSICLARHCLDAIRPD
jgi:hypothetical protein